MFVSEVLVTCNLTSTVCRQNLQLCQQTCVDWTRRAAGRHFNESNLFIQILVSVTGWFSHYSNIAYAAQTHTTQPHVMSRCSQNPAPAVQQPRSQMRSERCVALHHPVFAGGSSARSFSFERDGMVSLLVCVCLRVCGCVSVCACVCVCVCV